MPIRLLREGILTSDTMPSLSKRKYVPIKLRHKIAKMPCRVCGVPFSIHADHVVPVALGGMGTEDNLQPLCRDCNYAKSHRRTNEQVALVIVGRGIDHFMRAVFREDTRYYNDYDGPSMSQWAEANPDRVRLAVSLYLAFMGKSA